MNVAMKTSPITNDRGEEDKPATPILNPRCLTKRQLAIVLNCCERSIENLVTRGLIRAHKSPCVGTRFNLDEVEKSLGLKEGS
jgi:hypothetical protein